jgi:hypothetical protein
MKKKLTQKEEYLKASRWEPMVYRPELPEGWHAEEQQIDSKRSSISFVKYGRTHHNGKLEKIYIVFIEFNKLHWRNIDFSYQYTIRGGRHAKPGEIIAYFKDIRSAEKHLLWMCQETDKWLEQVNSPETIRSYDKKMDLIRKAIEQQ